MASFALMNAYSGFKYDMSKKQIGFSPISNGTYLWSVAKTYGTVSINDEKMMLTVLGEPLDLSTLLVEKCKCVEIDGQKAVFTKTENGISLNQAIKSKLIITL